MRRGKWKEFIPNCAWEYGRNSYLMRVKMWRNMWKECIPSCGRFSYLNVQQGYVQGVHINVQKYVEGVYM
jgi:hypothetical protein